LVISRARAAVPFVPQLDLELEPGELLADLVVQLAGDQSALLLLALGEPPGELQAGALRTPPAGDIPHDAQHLARFARNQARFEVAVVVGIDGHGHLVRQRLADTGGQRLRHLCDRVVREVPWEELVDRSIEEFLRGHGEHGRVVREIIEECAVFGDPKHEGGDRLEQGSIPCLARIERDTRIEEQSSPLAT